MKPHALPVTPQPWAELLSQQGSVSVGNPSFPMPLCGVVVSKGPVSAANVSLPEMRTEMLFSLSASLCAEQGQWLTSLGQAGLSHV